MLHAACVFDLLNDGQSEMLLYLEPAGSKYMMLPGKAVQVHIFGSECPIEMKHSTDVKGRKLISFWPIDGSFELFFDGKSIWEQILARIPIIRSMLSSVMRPIWVGHHK